jgi:hypothetical protein
MFSISMKLCYQNKGVISRFGWAMIFDNLDWVIKYCCKDRGNRRGKKEKSKIFEFRPCPYQVGLESWRYPVFNFQSFKKEQRPKFTNLFLTWCKWSYESA